MKLLPILTAICGLLFVACEKDDTFCINDILVKATGTVGELTLKTPDGQSYSGQGALPTSIKIGKYEGKMSSVITKQTQTAKGFDVELVHLFDDGKGNAFWTNDKATLTPLNAQFTQFQVYDELTVVGGTGDFECASGKLINQGPLDFVTGTLQANMTGSVCGGCD
ncbi:MAG: hypothetical protein ACK4TA_25580 [Saprospiraceae bacterium]